MDRAKFFKVKTAIKTIVRLHITLDNCRSSFQAAFLHIPSKQPSLIFSAFIPDLGHNSLSLRASIPPISMDEWLLELVRSFLM